MKSNLKLATYAVGVVCGLAAFWLLIAVPAVGAAHISSSYVAKSLCSCVFVDGSDPGECRGDLAPGYAAMRIKLDRGNQSVRAGAGLIASDVARYERAYGCHLEMR